MRKLIVVGVLAAVAIAVLAVPAFASFDRHFSVISKEVSERRIQNGFAFKDKLLDPRNRQDRSAATVASAGSGEARKIRCHGRSPQWQDRRLRDIRLSGDLGPGDRRVNVVGGTADFNGVAGKMLIRSLGRNTDKLHFDLVR